MFNKKLKAKLASVEDQFKFLQLQFRELERLVDKHEGMLLVKKNVTAPVLKPLKRRMINQEDVV